jgi:menaquinone-dependent protoporphyrinogen oxidase
MRALVSVASKHDSTSEIGAAIAKSLRDAGLEVEVIPPDKVASLQGVDAVVLGSAVYYGKWLAPAAELVERHRDELLKLPVWLFSSGPLGSPDPKPEGVPAGVSELAESIHARGHRVFAGSLDKRQLGLGERAIVRVVKAPSGDFRDWATIGAWAHGIAQALIGDRVAVG